MRVLDIDLDFFLADTCPLAEMGCRPAPEGHEPWEADEVVRFLEHNLGLSAAHPVPGRIFETHDGALAFWDEMRGANRLTLPFEVTHVDAHSDLGIGFPGPGIVLNGALCRKLAARCDVGGYYALGQLDEANYLLYALAFRWVSRLENLRNPNSRPDMPLEIVFSRGADGLPTALWLTPPLAELFEKQNGPEPVITYREYPDAWEYVADAPFDFVTLARSPRYAPAEADFLADVIGQFIGQY